MGTHPPRTHGPGSTHPGGMLSCSFLLLLYIFEERPFSVATDAPVWDFACGKVMLSVASVCLPMGVP